MFKSILLMKMAYNTYIYYAQHAYNIMIVILLYISLSMSVGKFSYFSVDPYHNATLSILRGGLL